MKTIIKTAVLGAAFVLLMLIGEIQITPTPRIGMFSDAHAIAGVRRRTRRRTAVVVHSADQAAAANAAAAAAAATPAPAPAATAAPGALPLGSVTTTLPAGCTPVTAGGVEYQHCGPDYYRATFQANNLVYVTAQP